MRQIKTFYFDKNSNFGDQLNVTILSNIFGVEPLKTSPENSELVCIGSLLESFLHGSNDFKLAVKKIIYPKTIIWGTGFIAPENTRIIRPNGKSEIFYKNVEVQALRGNLTKARVEKFLNQDLSRIPVGDPGLLVSKLIKTPEISKKYRLGIVPHYVDASSSKVKSLYASTKDSTVIDILLPPIEFLRRIAECEVIISSAMHGLIAADGLGIPNRRLILSDKIFGGDYKFNDYYSVFGVDNHDKIDLRTNSITFIDAQELTRNYPIKKEKLIQIQESLMESFPAFED